jgi:hypothetical protein
MWLLLAGTALWVWYEWIIHIGGIWEVLSLPLGIFGLYALLNKAPSALDGKRLLIDDSGITFFPSDGASAPAYLPWDCQRSVAVEIEPVEQIVVEPAPETLAPKHGALAKLWSEENQRFEINVIGMPLPAVCGASPAMQASAIGMSSRLPLTSGFIRKFCERRPRQIDARKVPARRWTDMKYIRRTRQAIPTCTSSTETTESAFDSAATSPNHRSQRQTSIKSSISQ